MSAEIDPTAITTEAPTTQAPEPSATVDAHVCGALGCRKTDDLRRAHNPERGTRVLCSDHATHFENGGGRR